MRVDFPYTYTTKYTNAKKGLSERKLGGTLTFDVDEARPEDVQLLLTWTMPTVGQGVPGSCIRWRGSEYVTLSHVDPFSPVMRSDLPVGSTYVRRHPWLFLSLYEDIGNLSDGIEDLLDYLRGDRGRFASEESPKTVSSNRAEVIQDMRDMLTGILIVGDTVYQRIVGAHVCIERSFTRETPYAGYLCFTKFREQPKGVFDRHGALRSWTRMDDLRFPVADYQRVRPRITRVYEQVFSDLTVYDEAAFPYDSEWELMKKVAVSILTQTAKDIGSKDNQMIEGWLELRDVVNRFDAERVATEIVMGALQNLAKVSGRGWVSRAVASCRASLAVYRSASAEARSEAA